jgi:hypothetical protein
MSLSCAHCHFVYGRYISTFVTPIFYINQDIWWRFREGYQTVSGTSRGTRSWQWSQNRRCLWLYYWTLCQERALEGCMYFTVQVSLFANYDLWCMFEVFWIIKIWWNCFLSKLNQLGRASDWSSGSQWLDPLTRGNYSMTNDLRHWFQ